MASPAHVLIVDDNEDLRSALAVLVHSEGHQVIEAADGQLALEALALDPSVVLVILDLMMPVVDGATFLKYKSRSAYAKVPVVVLSSSPFEGLDTAAGVTAMVSKTDGIDGLLAAIQNVVPSAA